MSSMDRAHLRLIQGEYRVRPDLELDVLSGFAGSFGGVRLGLARSLIKIERQCDLPATLLDLCNQGFHGPAHQLRLRGPEYFA
jgi:hypothetical protein